MTLTGKGRALLRAVSTVVLAAGIALLALSATGTSSVKAVPEVVCNGLVPSSLTGVDPCSTSSTTTDGDETETTSTTKTHSTITHTATVTTVADTTITDTSTVTGAVSPASTVRTTTSQTVRVLGTPRTGGGSDGTFFIGFGLVLTGGGLLTATFLNSRRRRTG